MSNDQMTIESSDLQVNSPSAFSQPMDAKSIDAKELTCTAPVAQLNAATAEVAKLANAFSPGSASGASLASLAGGINVKATGGSNGGGDEKKEVELNGVLNPAQGMLTPTFDEMPNNYHGLFVVNEKAYLGMGSYNIPLTATPTTPETDG